MWKGWWRDKTGFGEADLGEVCAKKCRKIRSNLAREMPLEAAHWPSAEGVGGRRHRLRWETALSTTLGQLACDTAVRTLRDSSIITCVICPSATSHRRSTCPPYAPTSRYYFTTHRYRCLTQFVLSTRPHGTLAEAYLCSCY